MSNYLISGSSAYDALACPARVVLPGAFPPPSEFAERGEALHLFAQRMTDDPSRREQYLDAIANPEWRETARKMNVADALDGITIVGTEVAFALNVMSKTCRMIGSDIDRDYDGALERAGEPPLTVYEIPFTVDVLGEINDVPVELDYKTGMSIGEVEEHGQRRISATGLMLYYGSDSAISRVAYVREDGSIDHDGFEFSAIEADGICEELKAGIDKILATKLDFDNRKQLTVYPDRNKQCKYCPAFDSCPYWNNLVTAAVGEVKRGTITADIQEVDKETAGRALESVKDVIKVFEEILEKLKVRVDLEGPLPLPNGKEYYMREMEGKKYFDSAAARGKLYSTLLQTGLPPEECDKELDKLMKQGKKYKQLMKRNAQ